ncbi:MAG: FAD-dependent thymidylate synthase [Chloroflexi bacterium]|nr:FAD-dependent thymidylate synthase [Chloroflexota bacterium]
MSAFVPHARVRLVNAFARPYENAVATARTCYSAKGIVTPDEVARQPEVRDRIARGIYAAGHHTTFQHAHFQFTLENVSRHFIWDFLHSHPFYNSEQVSQRYVRVRPDAMVIPPLEGKAREVYVQTLQVQVEAYEQLIHMLMPAVEQAYFERFPHHRPKKGGKAHRLARRWIPRKAQEVARYVLPVATTAYLYHTISLLTLFRYYRLARQCDVPTETWSVVQAMVQEVLRWDPELERLFEEPIPLEETLEYAYWQEGCESNPWQKEYREEFDRSLEGFRSRLVGYKENNEALLAQGVREVLGLPRARLSDEEAIALVLDPRRNRYLAEALNLTAHAKLTRVLHHPSYTFRKKLSHTADSQDQRHRLTPGSRPLMSAYLTEEPDYITPALIREEEAARRYYAEVMEQIWAGIGTLRRMGVPGEYASYLLPNAVAIRFTESADLLGLHHKLRMRLCYNAQEEIFTASVEEARQIAQVNPRIGQYLGPPCRLRYLAGVKPYCPEGERYCGVRVWELGIG